MPGGSCEDPCKSDDDCFLIPLPQCNLETGKCGCISDQGCKDLGAPGRPACVAGTCGHAVDSDCAPVGDRCHDGRCGCSSAAACGGEKVFDGTVVVCEGP